jgi:hypothetical protein
VPARAQFEELALGVSLRVLRLLIGRHFRPLRVAMTHAPVSNPARYRAFFDADVQFEQDHCGFGRRRTSGRTRLDAAFAGRPERGG